MLCWSENAEFVCPHSPADKVGCWLVGWVLILCPVFSGVCGIWVFLFLLGLISKENDNQGDVNRETVVIGTQFRESHPVFCPLSHLGDSALAA